MAQYTNNLNLYKPSRYDQEPVDETLANNFETIDNKLGSGLVKTDGTTYPDLAARLKEIEDALLVSKGASGGVTKKYINIAHRGHLGSAPENTLPAFAYAIERGFDAIETDLYLTSDNEFVLIHDATVDRTTDGTGNVVDFTLAGIRALEAGSWFHSKFAGTPVPTLYEFLDMCKKNNMIAVPEIKQEFNQSQIDQLIAVIEDYNMVNETVFISFHQSSLNAVRNTNEQIKLGYLTSTFDQSVIDYVKGLGNAFINAKYSAITQSLVDSAQSEGLEVGAWTVDDMNVYRDLTNMGVQYITTNDIPNTGVY